ncbi:MULTISPECIES: helix-turn-helix domain-containing protein [Niastella]|uniref:Helix-turn-helix transcriptional regulator n=1 Tax=Niastella soli TaxID=2821487 RepID=A0ABS3YVL0_9BACT|nr:AraC family transcriptional regulator [Niastella soli]MBO9201937.1 helix-turn-helix transcriptional regulator [Niastella soli]
MADLQYQINTPDPLLREYVDSFWLLHNQSHQEKTVVILPDGRIDLFLSRSSTEPFRLTLMGIGSQPDQAVIAPNSTTYAISFKLPAVEYIFGEPMANLLNTAQTLPPGFWGFMEADLQHFDHFCRKASQLIQSKLPAETDTRKMDLFNRIYEAQGNVHINEVSQQVYWSSRQINRYFNQQFGLSMKAYCDILRFRAAFPQLKEGKLFPEEGFADQSHFIKAVKKLAGVSPKVLNQNPNGRFIQFSTLDGQ